LLQNIDVCHVFLFTTSDNTHLNYFTVAVCFLLIYLLTAIGLPPGGSSTVHIYTQTIHRMTQNKQYIEQHKNIQYIEQYKYGRVRAVPRLCELYPGICLTTEEKARKNLSQGSRTISIYRHNNKNI
jgi:hypothetical protein